MTRGQLSRRRFLQALCAAPLALPLLRNAHASPRPPRRLVLVMQNNGTQQKSFWPDANLSSPILDHLFLDDQGRDNGLRAKTNLVKGVYVPSDLNGTNGNEHDMGFARMFTGEKLISVGGQPWGGGTSVDQLLAKRWNEESLALAVLASQQEPFPKAGYDHRESFSYLGPGTIKHPVVDPLTAWKRLFPPPDPRLGRRLSVLDAVAGNLADVSARLGPAERRKLDYHATAIRSVERRITARLNACPGRPAPPTDYLALDPHAEVNTDAYITRMVDDMVDLAAIAVGCSLTRVVTLQFGYAGGKWRFAWEGIDDEVHGAICHNDTRDSGSTPDNTEKLVRMNRYYARAIRRLATQLDAMPEGDGTVLDNTLLVWANEMGRGNHGMENLPIVLLGKAGGTIHRGGRVLDHGPQVFNRLGCTILNAMGVAARGFGDEPECGSFPGLLG